MLARVALTVGSPLDSQTIEPCATSPTWRQCTVGREIPTSEEVSDRLIDGDYQYKIIRMAVAHSMESMTNAPVIMFKVESGHPTEFN